MKDIFKILIFKQVVIPFICLFFMVLLLPKATVILAAKTTINPQLLATTFAVIVFAVTFGIWYVWYPYTCIDLWKTSNKLSQGWKSKLTKGYATIFLLLIIVPGIFVLLNLPDIYSKLDAHNNLSKKVEQKTHASP